jgi:hypothetical protein
VLTNHIKEGFVSVSGGAHEYLHRGAEDALARERAAVVLRRVEDLLGGIGQYRVVWVAQGAGIVHGILALGRSAQAVLPDDGEEGEVNPCLVNELAGLVFEADRFGFAAASPGGRHPEDVVLLGEFPEGHFLFALVDELEIRDDIAFRVSCGLQVARVSPFPATGVAGVPLVERI